MNAENKRRDLGARIRNWRRHEEAIEAVAAFVRACGIATGPEIAAYLDDLDPRAQQAAICAAHRRGLVRRVRGGGRFGPAVYRPPLRDTPRAG